MNLLSIDNNGVFVEAASVGQRFYDNANFGHKYKLRRAFWLNKEEHNSYFKIDHGQNSLFLSSFANLFWHKLDDVAYKKVFDLINQLKKSVNLFQLNFNKTKDVWNYVTSIE
jgi:hypothetical protein